MTSQLDSLFDWENYENESLYECVCAHDMCSQCMSHTAQLCGELW